MASPTVSVDGSALAAACGLLDIRLGDVPALADVSRRTWQQYYKQQSRVSDKTLRALFAFFLDRANSPEVRGRIIVLFQEMIASADAHFATCKMELARRGSNVPPFNHLPHTSALMAEVGGMIDEAINWGRRGEIERADQWFAAAESQSPADPRERYQLYSAWGDMLFNNGLADRAIRPFDEALQIQPGRLEAQINVAKAHLDARLGDPLRHWQRASRVIGEAGKRSGPSRPPLLELWSGVVHFRNPSLADEEKWEASAAALEKAVYAFSMADDPLSAIYAESQLAVVWFRSRKKDKQRDAIRLLQRLVLALQGPATAYPRAIALKRLANCLQLLPTTGRSRLNHLTGAAARYDKASRILRSRGLHVEWALARYSYADACIARGKLGDRSRSWFRKAIEACEDALGVLTINHRDDWGRAVFNLAEAHEFRPKRGRVETTDDLIQAVKYYRRTLQAFPREYIPSEWADTLRPLARVLYRLWELRGKAGYRKRAIACLTAVSEVSEEANTELVEMMNE